MEAFVVPQKGKCVSTEDLGDDTPRATAVHASDPCGFPHPDTLSPVPPESNTVRKAKQKKAHDFSLRKNKPPRPSAGHPDVLLTSSMIQNLEVHWKLGPVSSRSGCPREAPPLSDGMTGGERIPHEARGERNERVIATEGKEAHRCMPSAPPPHSENQEEEDEKSTNEERKKSRKKEEKKGTASSLSTKCLPPPFKVGTLEMYKRFPEVYASFMRHHDCSAVQKILYDVLDAVVRSHTTLPSPPILTATTSPSSSPALSVDSVSSSLHRSPQKKKKKEEDLEAEEVVRPPPAPCRCTDKVPSHPLFSASSSSLPFLKVMDLGCGTGRIEEMLVRHPSVASIFAYDKEPSMLRQCILHTMRAALSVQTMPSHPPPNAVEEEKDGRTTENDLQKISLPSSVVATVPLQRHDEEKERFPSPTDAIVPLWQGRASTAAWYRSCIQLQLPTILPGMSSPSPSSVVSEEAEKGGSSVATHARETNAEHQQQQQSLTCFSFQRSSTPPMPSTDAMASTALLSFPLQLTVRPVSFESIQQGFLHSPFSSTSSSSSSCVSPSLGERATASHPACHVIVCAWSLSYLMRQQWGGDRWHAAVDQVLQYLWDGLEVAVPPPEASFSSSPSPKAALVIIETLGKGVEGPSRQSTFTERLETVWGFEKHCVRTDYHFSSREDAVAYTTFFFGKDIARQMAQVEVEEEVVVPPPTASMTPLPHPTGNPMEDAGEKEASNATDEWGKRDTKDERRLSCTAGVVLPEYTGIWIKWKVAHSHPQHASQNGKG